MTAIVEDARALMRMLRQQGWNGLYVRTSAGEIFMAMPAGRPNPMLHRPAVTARDERGGTDAVERQTELTVVAPHVGTVLWTAPVGAEVHAGIAVCRLEVLGEVIEVTSPAAGTLADACVQVGELVEYETPLVRIEGGPPQSFAHVSASEHA